LVPAQSEDSEPSEFVPGAEMALIDPSMRGTRCWSRRAARWQTTARAAACRLDRINETLSARQIRATTRQGRRKELRGERAGSALATGHRTSAFGSLERRRPGEPYPEQGWHSIDDFGPAAPLWPYLKPPPPTPEDRQNRCGGPLAVIETPLHRKHGDRSGPRLRHGSHS